jgi:hypothetical protein
VSAGPVITPRSTSVSSNLLNNGRNTIVLANKHPTVTKSTSELASSNSFQKDRTGQDSPTNNKWPPSRKSLKDSKTDSSILLNRLKSINKELLCSMIALSLQIILFVSFKMLNSRSHLF